MERNTKFFNTGLIPKNSDQLRIEQGLLPQNPANLCAFNFEGTVSGEAGNPVKLYPAYQVPQPTYGLGKIKDDCNCTINVQAP